MLYIIAGSAILATGQFVYYRYRVGRLQVMANNSAALEIAVASRDAKILALEANLREKNEGEHAKDVKEAAGIGDIAGAIRFLRTSGGGGGDRA